MNEFSKEQLLEVLDASVLNMREQFGMFLDSENAVGEAARRLLRAFADIRRRVEVSL